MSANHQPKKVNVGRKLLLVERGSFHTSILKLSERWFADRKTVTAFLQLLEKDNMIIMLRSRQDGTTIKVSNYERYQAFSDSDADNKRDNERDNESTSKAHRKGHKQEVKNDKKKENPPYPPSGGTDDFIEIEKSLAVAKNRVL